MRTKNENITDVISFNTSDLPQVASRDDVVINVLQNNTHLPHEMIDAEIHGQIDPSYS